MWGGGGGGGETDGLMKGWLRVNEMEAIVYQLMNMFIIQVRGQV